MNSVRIKLSQKFPSFHPDEAGPPELGVPSSPADDKEDVTQSRGW